MSKYEPLRQFLRSRSETQVPLSFEKIEVILGCDLPRSARKYAPWWANVGGTHVQASAWLDAGWRTSNVDIPGNRVVFVRDVGDQARLPSGSSDPSGLAVRPDDLSPVVQALLHRHMAEHGYSLEQAISDLLHQIALDRRRSLLERFPMSGARSSVDSVGLVREDRDAR
jgi:hypothetical protein